MKKFYYYTPIFLQKVGYVVFYPLHRFFVRIEIHGRENLSGLKGPIVLAVNHTSELDVTTIPLALSFFSPLYPVYFVNNPIEKFKTFGWKSYIYGQVFFNVLGGYSVHSGFHDYAVSLEDHIDLIEKGRTVCIFPEGRRTLDGKLGFAHGGMGFMVYETGATVVPIAIDTFFNITAWEYFGLKRKVKITILPPMSVSDLISAEAPIVEDFKLAGQKVLDKIGEVLKN